MYVIYLEAIVVPCSVDDDKVVLYLKKALVSLTDVRLPTLTEIYSSLCPTSEKAKSAKSKFFCELSHTVFSESCTCLKIVLKVSEKLSEAASSVWLASASGPSACSSHPLMVHNSLYCVFKYNSSHSVVSLSVTSPVQIEICLQP